MDRVESRRTLEDAGLPQSQVEAYTALLGVGTVPATELVEATELSEATEVVEATELSEATEVVEATELTGCQALRRPRRSGGPGVRRHQRVGSTDVRIRRSPFAKGYFDIAGRVMSRVSEDEAGAKSNE